MAEKNSFGWLGLKGEGLPSLLFGMGVFLYFTKIQITTQNIGFILLVLFLDYSKSEMFNGC